MEPIRELSGAEKALFEALMSQGCSALQAARIAAEQAEERRETKRSVEASPVAA